MVRTLNKLSDLRETKFGQPHPRHGLNLLWWFAHDCVQIDFNGRKTAQCDPENGVFGFHRFYNREKLLPHTDLLYYVVGNLNTTGSLPHFVTKSYTGHSDNSNSDRIIVSFHSKWKRFENIYVTQHSDKTYFDQNHTYRISTELIKDIQDLSREEFLREPTNRSEHASTGINQPVQTITSQSKKDLIWEEILRECTNHPEHVSMGIHPPVQTNISQSTGNELMKNVKLLNHEDFLREHTDCSEHVNTDVLQSVSGETCHRNELTEDIKELNHEDFRSEPTNCSEQLSIDIDTPQSAQRETCQSQATCGKRSSILRFALLTVVIIAAIAWYLNQI